MLGYLTKASECGEILLQGGRRTRDDAFWL